MDADRRETMLLRLGAKVIDLFDICIDGKVGVVDVFR
jgi:hypothetical protein